ncbi:MAG: hypothetical protein AB7U79_03865 [Candidatus Izemoplasmatales bacterium]
MIKYVITKKDLKQFIFFVKKHYQNDPYFVPPIYNVLTKELKREVLKTKKYTAILALKNEEIVGRLLYTIDDSKMKNSKIGYYSFFESINDADVVKELFDTMEKDLLSEGMTYAEGTFTPYDPDTRRGVLVMGFDKDPTIMTSYNYAYYGSLLESIGYVKALDTFSLKADICDETTRKLTVIEKYFEARHEVQIDSLNFKDLDKDIQDVHEILKTASIELNYQEAPSIDLIQEVAKSMKLFIRPEFIKIAREKETLEPVGFALVLPDFNQVIKKAKGKLNLYYFLRSKKYITRARGLMQYVVPKYQNTGLIGVMFKKVYDHFLSEGITTFEAGTMVEENMKAMSTFMKFGGEITKTYRIYGKELSQ